MRAKALLIFCLMTIGMTAFTSYCGSNCLDYMGTCYSDGYSDTTCIVCAPSIYNIDPNPSTNSCVINNQTSILSIDLKSPITLTSFTGSSLTPFTCGAWALSGKYVEGSYLSKVYQTITYHYMVVVRYNLLYMGSGWSTTDNMTVAVDNNVTTFGYTCGYPTTICTTKDCPKIGQIQATHNSSNATIVFTSSVLNTSASSWGISNLIVVILTCHATCNTCFGASANQCLSCSNTSYLLGNSCVKQCPFMGIPSLNLCAPSCPGGFYSMSLTKTCSPCSKGCSVCTGPLQTNCLLDVIEPSLWEQQRQFWIFLIVLAGVIIVVGLVFLVIKRRRDKIETGLKDPIISQKTKTPTEMDLSHLGTPDKSQVYMGDEINQSQSSSSNSNESDDGPKYIKVKRKWKGKQ